MARTLRDVCATLQSLAPLELAEPWDRVGLLVESYTERFSEREQLGFSAGAVHCLKTPVHRILLCIDLTEPVLDEAIRYGAELIVAYHPPLFDPLRSLRVQESSQRIIMRAVQARVAIYSPHTALDAAESGINDWLARGLGAEPHIEPLLAPDVGSSSGLVPVEARAGAMAGAGRRVLLSTAVSLPTLAERVKSHLGVTMVDVARAAIHRSGDELVRHIGVSAGAGGGIFEDMEIAEGPQVYVTGEMRHHQILHIVGQGASVILAGHTETERGYLPVFKGRLMAALEQTVEIAVSKSDRSPLESF